MNLTDDDKQRISSWINEKCGRIRCTLCGIGNWTLIDGATLPIGFDLHSTRFFYHQGIPQVAIACNNCGHVIFFNTAIMGFKPDEPEPEEIGKPQTDAEAEGEA